MSRKPENQFVSGVHKYLPPINELYRAKMNNPYTAGLPDWWYSGKRGDLWVEYKYIKELPKRDNTLIIPDLSDLQRDWLNKRYTEGRKVAVVIGCPEGGLFLDEPKWWNEGCSAADFKRWVESRQDVAGHIASYVYC